MLPDERRFVERPVVEDAALPSLSAVLDGSALSAHLGEYLPAEVRDPADFEVRLLRHHAGKRCVLELTWWADTRPLAYIAKVYAKDRSDVHLVMDGIRHAGLRGEFSIPDATAYVDELRLHLQERVDGRPATEALLSDDVAERGAAAERCATWLAAFHGVGLRTGKRVDLESRLMSAERWTGRLTRFGGTMADKALELLDRVLSAEAALPATDLCTIHGDYSHHQVLFADGRTVTVDWDKHRLSDPADDVARFVVGLQRLAKRRRGSMQALDATAERFLETYRAAAACDLSARVPSHRALICMEHAKHDVHKQSPGWRERAVAALDEGLRVLAEGG